MASTYSNLKIELIGDGEQVSVWGATTNDNFEAFEQAIGGYANVDFSSDANVTLGYADSNAQQTFRALYFNVTSSVSLTATRKLIVPAVQKMYIVKNATTGGQTLTVEISGGTGADIPNGETYIVYADGTDVVYAAPGLFYFDEVKSVASPNATVPVIALEASGAETNIDAAIVPKGTGAVIAGVPDNLAAGGNKRGANAVDLQTHRGAATNVAAGDTSTLAGGADNTITSTGTNAVISGGTANQNAAGSGVVAGGTTNNLASTATAGVISGGRDNSSQAPYATVVGGRDNETDVNAQYATVLGGYQASATRYGQNVHASGAFTTTVGTAQVSQHVLRIETINEFVTRATADGTGTANAYNTVNMPNNSLYAVHGFIVAQDTSTIADAKVWEVRAVIQRGNTAANTALLGTPTLTVLAEDSGAAAWAVTITADTGNGGLAVSVEGAVGTTIRWVCSLNTTEVVNG